MTDGLSPLALALRVAVAEVERHASEAGWDAPARLFALAWTEELVAAEPELAAKLGISGGTAERLSPAEHLAQVELFTPLEQELHDSPGTLEELLGRITWPDSVAGALAVVERVVLPPEAEGQVPDDPAEAADFAAHHDAREDVRISVGVLRTGETHCVLRMRSHDDDDSLVHGAEVVPGLVEALRETLGQQSDLSVSSDC